MAICGAGFGLFQSSNNRTMLAAAPRERSGAASGLFGVARLLGQTLALRLWRFSSLARPPRARNWRLSLAQDLRCWGHC
jgi:MFS transporter, DHA2 family, multidrug resistance protein